MDVRKANLYYFFFILLSIPVSLGIFSLFIPEDLAERIGMPLFYLLFFSAGCLILKKDNSPFFETLPYNIPLKRKTALLITAVTFLFMPMCTCLNEIGILLFGDFLSAVGFSENAIGDSILLNLFNIAVIPAVFEEMFFRGFFYRPYRESGGPGKAILLSALLFGLFHMNFQQAVYAFGFGIVIGILRELTGSMWAGMLLHFINNGWSALLMSLERLYDPDFLKYLPSMNLTFSDRPHIVYTLLMTAVCTPLLFFLLKKISAAECGENLLRHLFTGDCGKGEPLFTKWLAFGIAICLTVMILLSLAISFAV